MSDNKLILTYKVKLIFFLLFDNFVKIKFLLHPYGLCINIYNIFKAQG